MTMEAFIKEIIEYLEKEEVDYSYKEISVLKNNGYRRYGINVTGKNGNLSPCIYLDGFFAEYMNADKTMDTIKSEIMEILRKSIHKAKFDVAAFCDWENVKNKISCRLINKDSNLELLADVPYRDFLDLAIVYQVRVEEQKTKEGEVASILIHNAHLKIWEKEENDIYQALQENMVHNKKLVCRNIGEVLQNLLSDGETDFSEASMPMYVLGNVYGVNGASEIINMKNLEEIAKKLGGDFIVLPSSIHETILLPVSVTKSTEELACMVKEVNDTQLATEEILSYHVYRFFSDVKELKIVA